VLGLVSTPRARAVRAAARHSPGAARAATALALHEIEQPRAAAATCGGASAQLKMNERATFTSSSRSARVPTTNAPYEPSPLPSVPSSTSTPSTHRKLGAAAALRAPSVPVPCASSSNTSAPWRFAAPPSRHGRDVAVHAVDAVDREQHAPVSARGVAQAASERARSPCGNTNTSARESRQPSMIDACESASDTTASPLPTSAGITPRFAA
jgi:hypothetical protein